MERCWFEGFDEAIEVAAGYTTEMRISQTMIVPAPGHGPIQRSARRMVRLGREVQVRRRRTSQGCPAKAEFDPRSLHNRRGGLARLDGQPGPAPIQLEVNQCVFRANTLLAFNPKRPKQQKQIHWEGAANQYDILGRSWIVHSTAGSPAFSTEITDLDSWLHITPGEKKTIRSKLKYQIDPAKRPASLRPLDFAIEAPTPPQGR